jgi:hypothetical protein
MSRRNIVMWSVVGAVVLAGVGVTLGLTSGSGGNAHPKAPGPVVYSGTGDRTFAIRKPNGDPEEPVILTASGAGRFAVTLISATDKPINTPISARNGYQGSVLVDPEETEGSLTRKLAVVATGTWRLTLSPLSAVHRFSTQASGSGDQVLYFTGPAADVDVRHVSGHAPFIVTTLFADEPEPLVQAIGSYAHRVRLDGAGLVTVETRGAWSIRVSGS